ncbi:uncharacterized protein [Choristoneura fumiferana]|uniref:uncharacterized protein n=1 Tax=Choristoneura fumiferana TaxID=7141 RepID=UPI003D15946A
MPKRSSEEKINYYNAKIKRLKKRQLNKKQRQRGIILSSDSEDNIANGTQMDTRNVDNTSPSLPQVVRDRSPTPEPAAVEPDQAVSTEPRSPPASPPAALAPVLPAADGDSLDSELIEALGDPNDEIPVYGPEIHSMLAERWLPVLKKGLKSETKEKLLKEYAVPENCKLLKAPTVNPELRAAVNDVAKNRDKKIQVEQDQLGLGITAINRAMTVLLTQDNKVEAVKILSDGCRILSDLHFNQTEVRKKLITRGLDKAFVTNIQEQERDETLYGKTLPEKIKESKAIEKQGKDIKKTPTPKASTSNAPSQPPVSRSRFQGNWSTPPRYPTSSRGGRGTQYRSQYQHRGGPLTLAPPAYPASAHPATRPSSSTTSTGTRRAPPRH